MWGFESPLAKCLAATSDHWPRNQHLLQDFDRGNRHRNFNEPNRDEARFTIESMDRLHFDRLSDGSRLGLPSRSTEFVQARRL